MTLEELYKDDAWCSVFCQSWDAEGVGNHQGRSVSMGDIVRVIAATDSHSWDDETGPDYEDYETVIGVFELSNGDILVADDRQDMYEGFGYCPSLTVASSIEDAIQYGLTEDDKVALGL